MDIKLIPKEYKQQQKGIGAGGLKLPFSKKPVQSPFLIGLIKKADLWLALIIFLLSFSLLSWGGLFVYKDALIKEEASLQKQVDDLDIQRDKDLEERVKDLDKAIKSLRKLLDTHIYPSKLFDMIGELTVAQVQFVKLNADLTQNKINMVGKAISYTVLAQQLTVLENDQRIIKAETSNHRLGYDGQVQFNLVLEFDPSFLQYQPSSL